MSGGSKSISTFYDGDRDEPEPETRSRNLQLSCFGQDRVDRCSRHLPLSFPSMSESSTLANTNNITAQDHHGSTPLSKNAIKKAAKAERLAALKLERRAREKEAKKEKKRIRAEKRAAGELDDDEEEDDIRRRTMKRPKLQFGGTVVVDLGFDSMMNDKVSQA